VPAILAGLSFFVCCFPVGLIAAALGFRQFKVAQEQGRSMPIQAVLAMVLGVGSLGTSGFLAWQMKKDNDAQAAQAAKVLGEVKDARKQETLDAKTACSLAELWFLDTQGIGAVETKCPQPMEATTLPDVEFRRSSVLKHFNVCFARSEGEWVVWGALHAGTCPDAPQAAGEKAMREAGKLVLEKATIDAWKLMASRVRQVAESGEFPEKCPASLSGEVHLVDVALLAGEKGAKDWDFLTTSDIARALPAKGATADKAKDALDAMGSAVAVLVAEKRELPREVNETTFDMGSFDGTLVLVDPKKGEALCSANVSFENSKSLGGGVKVGLKLGPKVNVGEESPQGDFEKNADKELARAMKELTGGKASIDR
jgi:hypothetical protein